MKEILSVMYLNRREEITVRDYDVDELDMGYVVEPTFRFQICSKRSDSLYVSWKTRWASVERNGDSVELIFQDLYLDETGEEYPIVEILSLRWVSV